MQSTSTLRPVGKDLPRMRITVRRPHFGTNHAVAGIGYFIDETITDGSAEAGPATAGVELVARGKQWLAGDDIDIDTDFLLVQILAGARTLGSMFLGDAIRFTAWLPSAVFQVRPQSYQKKDGYSFLPLRIFRSAPPSEGWQEIPNTFRKT